MESVTWGNMVRMEEGRTGDLDKLVPIDDMEEVEEEEEEEEGEEEQEEVKQEGGG